MFKLTLVSFVFASIFTSSLAASVDPANTKKPISEVPSESGMKNVNNGYSPSFGVPSNKPAQPYYMAQTYNYGYPINFRGSTSMQPVRDQNGGTPMSSKNFGLFRGGYGGQPSAPIILRLPTNQAYSLPAAPQMPYQPGSAPNYPFYTYGQYGQETGLYRRAAEEEKMPAAMDMEHTLAPSVSYQTKYVIRPQELQYNDGQLISQPTPRIVGYNFLPNSAASYGLNNELQVTDRTNLNIAPQHPMNYFYSMPLTRTALVKSRSASNEESEPNIIAQTEDQIFLEFSPTIRSMTGQQSPETARAAPADDTLSLVNGPNSIQSQPQMNWQPPSDRDGSSPFSHDQIMEQTLQYWKQVYAAHLETEKQILQMLKNIDDSQVQKLALLLRQALNDGEKLKNNHSADTKESNKKDGKDINKDSNTTAKTEDKTQVKE